ncbi:class II aldolase/adducin family protein [Parvibaculum sp.]|uniref:class II aldolase/adducin family protein n=1 Tax=Parvibaculum sp. TaxID=2024848 RepID=UPI002C593EBD|nr:class II aldolase/adducin family protein [Parvibaculum sp.]HUD51652.1 class II aldolase/adducin family protein [Parvibaculum sp.]
MQGNSEELRRALVAAMLEMDTSGLNSGTAGNASVRLGDRFLVTPSGIPAGRLTPESMVEIDRAGEYKGDFRPTSEWRMHVELLVGRQDVNAVVHCHSQYATTLACAGRSIPPLHYMTAVSGGAEIRVAPYALFGTEALARSVIDTLEGRRACLMANHGQIALGRSLGEALMIAREVEVQASYYFGTLAIGGPKILSDEDMNAVFGAFLSYGQKKPG